jgi:hypothetical protein
MDGASLVLQPEWVDPVNGIVADVSTNVRISARQTLWIIRDKRPDRWVKGPGAHIQ